MLTVVKADGRGVKITKVLGGDTCVVVGKGARRGVMDVDG